MIRKFESKDIDTVMQTWKNENIKVHDFIKKEYWESNFEYVKNILPNAEIFVYIYKEEVVGFIGLNGNYIEGIFVDTDNQYNGIGTALLNKVKEDRGILTLKVYQKNINAVDFYKKNGFKVIEEGIDQETGEKELNMRWER